MRGKIFAGYAGVGGVSRSIYIQSPGVAPEGRITREMQNAECILNAECRMQNAECRMQNAREMRCVLCEFVAYHTENAKE